jgi:hypothetical protein
LRTFHAALESDIAATREIREAIEGKTTIRMGEEQPPIKIDNSAIPSYRVQVAFHPLWAWLGSFCATVCATTFALP